MHAALLAANMAAWLHELTGTLGGGGETEPVTFFV
jgi:hypothetical protein